jgi:hypothetical protein
VFWVISAYFNIRNTLSKSGTFLLGYPLYIAGMEKMRNAFNFIVKPEGNRPFERSKEKMGRYFIILSQYYLRNW